ncbi:type I-C CRISPR-associated protein Cas8c/Csd1 [Bifidobacterium eulemuris]|uniref:CRISPR-associated protein n=2 Tax=Bifidobacterium eulemuris TaxID=1765219 RepID=A0A261FXT1_9BIFI|nr:type I-C CRISPR-associated protein Cas8c/Csd1 [Bifidobacterium eulemuris]OZG64004.1 CRISPR-associated protein [Bifidobacterium eulemuris]QOL32837.1 type I-C CRISPR-associated protein Cas8c/Csd1 [Bifidobacterium eulemuris]
MSLWSCLLTTFDSVQNAAGLQAVEKDANGNDVVDEKKTLLPLYHTTMHVQICVTLNQHGELLHIEKEPRPRTIIIPCTEESMGRTSKPVPHPLCDQLQYVDKGFDDMKTTMYLKQLAEWKGNDPKLNAIYAYVSARSVSEDASECGVALSEKDRKIGIRFAVQLPGEYNPHVEDDVNLRNRWIEYRQRGRMRDGTDLFGKELYAQAANFPKNIVGTAGNAKLISANDSTNFTFRGRYADRDEALRIDAETSQKIHSTLRWLINRHGTITDTQAIVTWAVGAPNDEIVDPMAQFGDLSDFLPATETESDALQDALVRTDVSYAKRFRALLGGYGSPDFLERHADTMVVVILDAATSGRLSVTYYRELQKDEYIESVMNWHVDSSWPMVRFEKDSAKTDGSAKPIHYIGSPSFIDIINCAYPTTDRSGKSYKRFEKNVRKQLIECMFSNSELPRSLLNAVARKVSRPMGYDSPTAWNRDLGIACSMWKKHFNDEFKRNGTKEIKVELDPKRTDRDYLYGRLLALMDNFEEREMYRRGIGGTRQTNAMRLMSNFAAKPYATWGNLWDRLLPYMAAASPGVSNKFRDDIDDVIALFENGEYEDKSPLSPLYLVGYSHQRRYLRQQAQEKAAKKRSEAE